MIHNYNSHINTSEKKYSLSLPNCTLTFIIRHRVTHTFLLYSYKCYKIIIYYIKHTLKFLFYYRL